MSTKKSIEFTIRNHINTFVLNKPGYIKNKYYKNKDDKIENEKEFTIKYQDHAYVFERLYDDENILILYSYDGDESSCVTLFLNKDEKSIELTSFGKITGCFKAETNIGSNLLKITLKMIEKYKDYFKINKITLSDISTMNCHSEKKEKINGKLIKFSLNMGIMKTLLTGDTWYGAYGFRPFDKNTYELDETGNKIYDENKNIMKTITLKDIKLEKYLSKINATFPEEFTKEHIKEIIDSEKNPNKLLKDFLSEFTNLKVFDKNCKYFNTFYKELFNDIGLKNAGHFYGKFI